MTTLRIKRTCTLLPLLLMGSVTVSAAEGDWQAQAMSALQAALTQQHPTVTSWHITALTGQRMQQRLSDRAVARVEVARIGKRSAIRIWCEVEAPRACATVWFAVNGMQPVLSARGELAQ